MLRCRFTLIVLARGASVNSRRSPVGGAALLADLEAEVSVLTTRGASGSAGSGANVATVAGTARSAANVWKRITFDVLISDLISQHG